MNEPHEATGEASEASISVDSLEQALALFGSGDENIRLLQRQYNISVLCRGTDIKITGTPDATARACKVIESLLGMYRHGEKINEQSIQYVMAMYSDGQDDALRELSGDGICMTVTGKIIRPKTVGQKHYIDFIRANTIVLGIGPAGTGKTYLAVAMAVKALRAREVSRIILTRPAVEAGEKLGFLPGALQDKVDPYLRPLYDGLFDTMGAEGFARNMEKGSLEVAPLAYMRGRTLDDAFIILDEAQNTTREQIKMFLTRLGNNSRMVITGDITQIDLPDPKRSGLVEAMRVLRGIEGIAIHRFSDRDIVRHRLVQDIINAYERAGKS